MKLESKNFGHNEMMPPKYTCDGANISPHLRWFDIPDGVKSFALSCEDPDAPSGNWGHWYVYNIPFKMKEIPQGGPVLGTQIENDFGNAEYSGPCPPSGTHRYIFIVYALKKEKLTVVTKENFLSTVKDNVIQSAPLIGLYKRT